MTTNDPNPTDAALVEAVSRIADTDPSLAGAAAKTWLLLTEHEWPDDEGRTFSVFRCPNQPPWQALGLLRFATVQEEGRALYGEADDADDDE